MAGSPDPPSWFTWLGPILGALMTGLGAATLIIRRLLLGYTREELERILEVKHKENKEMLDKLAQKMEAGQEDRIRIREEIADIATEVAYIRGRLEKGGRM